MSEFDKKAVEWDANPVHVERSKAVADAMKKMVPLKKDMRALEFGAGTGLLSFELKDWLGHITLMDSSQEMIRVVTAKINQAAITNMTPLFFDLEKNNYTGGKFDLICSVMVLHHMDDVEGILGKCYDLLQKNGILAVADLYTEDGSFHDGSFTGHNGFDPENLKKTAESYGFSSVRYEECYTIRKTVGTEIKNFPVFLLVAVKK